MPSSIMGSSPSSDSTDSPIVTPSTVRRRPKLPRWFEGLSAILAVASIAVALVSATAPIMKWKDNDPTVWGIFALSDICFGVAFFLEYCTRLKFAAVRRKYVCSFMGIVDLLVCLNAIEDLVTIKQAWSATTHEDSFSVPSKFFWLLRFIRLLKLVRYMHEVKLIEEAVRLEARAMMAFVACILILACIIGSIMFAAEGAQEQTAFSTIPASIWWAIVTLTTVGYGDMVPKTYPGQIIASVVMLFGYSVLAVPTIVSVLSADNHFLNQFMEAHFSTREREDIEADTVGLTSGRAHVEQEMAVFASRSQSSPPRPPPTTSSPLEASKEQYPFVTLVSTRPSDYGAFGVMTASAHVSLIEIVLALWLKEEESLLGMRSGLRMSMASCNFTVAEPLRLSDDHEVMAGIDVMSTTVATETFWDFQIALFSKLSSVPSLVASVRQTWRSSDGSEAKGPERVFAAFRSRRAQGCSLSSVQIGGAFAGSMASRIGPGVSLRIGSQEAAKAAVLEYKH